MRSSQCASQLSVTQKLMEFETVDKACIIKQERERERERETDGENERERERKTE